MLVLARPPSHFQTEPLPTNGFSKKIENHSASVALYMMFYNFGRKHSTLGTSPAVKAGLTDHIWSVEEIVVLLEKGERNASEVALAARGTN